MSFLANRQRVTDLSGVLVFVSMTAPSFGATLRIVNDTQDWVSNGNAFVGFPFQLDLPDDTNGSPGAVRITVANEGRDLLADLEALLPSEQVWVRVQVADKSAPDAYNIDMHVPMIRASVTVATVQADAGYEPLMRQQAVRIRYNAFTAPGIF